MSRRHEYSQHFLSTPKIVAELIGHSNIKKNDTVYDLGAGSGIISDTLARRVKEVTAVEIEPGALTQLQANMRIHSNVKIVAQDIMEFTPGDRPYKIFANPPFSVIAPLVRRYTSLENSPKTMYLIVQKQFALKTVPSERHFTSQLGVQLAPYYEARIRKPLKRTDFTPPPAVDTVLLEFKKREVSQLPLKEMQQYQAFVTDCFSDPKKLEAASRKLTYKLTRHKPSELLPATWLELYTLQS